jgi:ABC-2 type transport system ATP-binding protein
MIDRVTQEADSLLEHLSKDPIACYPALVDFSDRYAGNPEIRKDVILLGSLVNEFVETRSYSSDRSQYKAEINKQGARIIDRIIEQHRANGEHWVGIEAANIREHYFRQKPTNRCVFSCTGVSKKISASFSLQDISLDLKLGEITGLVGENGNGKTSLLRIVAGEIRPDHGSVKYPFLRESRNNWIDIKRSIGVVKQTISPWRGVNSVRHQLQFTAAIKGITGKANKAQYDFIISRLNLSNFEDKQWNSLSGGFKLRFEIARQLMWRPKLLILDEPLANLDIKSQLLFLSDLRNLTNSISHSMSVIISSQNLYEIEKIADQIVFLRDGRPAYNGAINTVGADNKFRCYEIDTSANVLELQRALFGLPVREIRSETFYKLIYTEERLSSSELLQELAKRRIKISYFRDISHSTRLLFEK